MSFLPSSGTNGFRSPGKVESTGSTIHVNFTTSKRSRWQTDPRRCHVNWVILDSDWEAELCRVAESHPQSLNEFGIALATLDDDPGVRPESHIFVGSKAPWFEITDDLPQFTELPPQA